MKRQAMDDMGRVVQRPSGKTPMGVIRGVSTGIKKRHGFIMVVLTIFYVARIVFVEFV